MDSARNAVLQLEVHLGDGVLGEDGGVGDVADGGALDHVADGESLDGLVLGGAAGAVGAADRLHVAAAFLVTSTAITSLVVFAWSVVLGGCRGLTYLDARFLTIFAVCVVAASVCHLLLCYRGCGVEVRWCRRRSVQIACGGGMPRLFTGIVRGIGQVSRDRDLRSYGSFRVGIVDTRLLLTSARDILFNHRDKPHWKLQSQCLQRGHTEERPKAERKATSPSTAPQTSPYHDPSLTVCRVKLARRIAPAGRSSRREMRYGLSSRAKTMIVYSRTQALRNKIEKDLSKKRTNAGKSRQTRKAPPGTVLSLRPNQALQIKPNTTVTEAAQLMAAKREDCVLVTDDDDRIAGIFTAKDLAFRVVGAGLKASSVTIAEIMTKNPLCAKTDTSATDALDLMVRKGFRHLPVMDENHDISGILDITKCFYDAMEKLERAYSSSKKLYDALEGVQAELGSSQPQQIIHYVEALRSRMSGPTLESVLNGLPPTTVSVRTSVKEAAQLMKENHTTAVLVQDQGQITGIFTSKDVVLRVIAAGLDPATCSVIRVMTPHPDFAPLDMSIQQALRKMHDGHYLNLPVMNKENDEIVGMVDVLKLTYATLDQVYYLVNYARGHY